MGMILTGGCIIQLDRFRSSEWWSTVVESRCDPHALSRSDASHAAADADAPRRAISFVAIRFRRRSARRASRLVRGALRLSARSKAWAMTETGGRRDDFDACRRAPCRQRLHRSDLCALCRGRVVDDTNAVRGRRRRGAGLAQPAMIRAEVSFPGITRIGRRQKPPGREAGCTRAISHAAGRTARYSSSADANR